MAKSLHNWLEDIGQEEILEPTEDKTGAIQAMTKDEKLARSIWQRALGYQETIEHPDGMVSHTTHPPEAKAQQFIIERREGKFADPTKDIHRPKPLDRIQEKFKNATNKTASQSLNENDDSDPSTNANSDTDDTVSE